MKKITQSASLIARGFKVQLVVFASMFLFLSGFNTAKAQVLLTEDFNTMPPSGWSLTGFPTATNWGLATPFVPFTNPGGAAPIARFNWTPSQTNYDAQLVSPVINATANATVTLDYNMALDNYGGVINSWEVQYKTTASLTWTTLETFTNAGPSLDIVRTGQVLGGMGGNNFQIRVRIYGANSFDINGWYWDHFVVTGIGVVCTPPAVIGVSATPTSVCTGGSTLLTANGGISYTWAPSGTLSASTGTSVTATPTSNTIYTVTGSNGTCTATATVAINVNPNPTLTGVTATPASFCSIGTSTLAVTFPGIPPYCSSSATTGCGAGDEFISNVTFNTINKTSTCGENGPSNYTDYTAFSTSVTANTTVPFSAILGNPFSGDQMRVYCDWNQDGDFTDSGEETICVFSTPNMTGSVVVPAGALNGPTRMRVRMTYTTGMAPCGVSSYGETEDYTLNVSGGVNAYTYAWSPSSFLSSTTTNPTTANSITASTTYSVTVTNLLGCSASGTASVTVNTPPVATCGAITTTPGNLQVNIIGNGNYEDEITWTLQNASNAVILSGGPYGQNVSASSALTSSVGGPFTFFIEANGTFNDNSCLWNVTCNGNIIASGCIQGTLATAGCGSVGSLTVTGINGCNTVTSDFGNVSCNGGSNGFVGVTVTGGTPGYTYQWSNGGTTSTITGLAAGTYCVTVTDINGCTSTCCHTITEPPAVTANCGGTITSPGNLQVNIIGNGNFEDEITWTLKNASNVTILSGGPYGNNTSTSSGLTAAVNGPFTFFIEATGSFNDNSCLWNVTCNGNIVASGCIKGTANGGNCGSVGTLTVSNISGCITTTNPANVSCNGGNNGVATVIAGGGTPGYTYSWSNGGTNSSINGLTAGSYCVTVTDANGCTTTCCYTITEPTALVAAGSVTNVSCFGGSNGSVTMAPAGGVAPYTYLWANSSTSSSIGNLIAGSYCVTVSDANGCTATACFTVSEPGQLTANCSGTDVSCFGGNNGSASVSPSGGTQGYTYLWSTSETTSSIGGLSAGTYCVTITDANGCTATCCYTVNQPGSSVSASCSGTNVSCNGGADGTASVSGSGGTPGYSYLWNNGNINSSISGLSAGSYCVTVTDANGCTATCCYTVTEPTAIVVNCSLISNVSCNGGSNGSYSVSASGGTGAFTGTGTFANQTAGTYVVTVTDANGCNATCSVTIIEPDVLVASGNTTNVTCRNAGNGTITMAPIGGTAPYTYSWNGGNTNATRTGLKPGAYCVTVTDANGCTATNCFTIVQPTVTMVVNTSKTNIRCGGKCSGAAGVNPVGGWGGYTYLWSNGLTSASITNLCAGSYTCTVTDAGGCVIVKTIVITQNQALVVVGLPGPGALEATANPSGGVPPYTYKWNDPLVQTTQTATGLTPGSTYKVRVMDSKNCSQTAIVTIPTPKTGSDLNGEIFKVVIYPNPTDGIVNLNFSNNSAMKYVVAVYDLTGRQVMSEGRSKVDGESTAMLDLGNLPKGVYQINISSDKGSAVTKVVLQ